MDNVSLSPDVRSFLQNQVANGIYKSLSDAINANIGIIIVQTSMAKKKKEAIDAEIKKGLQDIKAGKLYDGIDFMNEVIARYEE